MYGFGNRECAGYFLSEDEFIRFAGLDTDDEQAKGFLVADVRVPVWIDGIEQEFEYLGTY